MQGLHACGSGRQQSCGGRRVRPCMDHACATVGCTQARIGSNSVRSAGHACMHARQQVGGEFAVSAAEQRRQIQALRTLGSCLAALAADDPRLFEGAHPVLRLTACL